MDCFQPLQKKSVLNVYLDPSNKLQLPGRFEEFKLKKWPLKLDDLEALLRNDPFRFVWLTQDAFVHLDPPYHEVEWPQFEQNAAISITWAHSRGRVGIVVRSETVEKTIACLNALVASATSRKTYSIEPHRIHLEWWQADRWQVTPPKPFPLNGQPLRAFFTSNASQKIFLFRRMQFNPSQSRLLARSNFGGLILDNCSFTDGGATFVMELIAITTRNNHKAALTEPHTNVPNRHWHRELDIYRSMPFEATIWQALLTLLSLSALTGHIQWKSYLLDLNLHDIPTPAAAINHWILVDCCFADHGDAVVEALHKNRGPCALHVENSCLFRTPEKLCAFFQALSANTSLNKLSLWFLLRGQEESVVQALASALETNCHLTGLNLREDGMSRASWRLLLSAISTNSSLLRLDMDPCLASDDKEGQRECVLALADMLTVNEHVEEIAWNFPDVVNNSNDNEDSDDTKGIENANDSSPATLFKRQVEARLELNRYRKKFRSLPREVTSHSLQGGLLGLALIRNKKITRNPSLLWTLLCENQELLVYQIQSRPLQCWVKGE